MSRNRPIDLRVVRAVDARLILFACCWPASCLPWISPHDSGRAVAHIYTVHQDRIRAGCIFTLGRLRHDRAWGVSVARKPTQRGLFPA